MSKQAVRWTIFAGIMFTVVGMCFLNYYSLFPQAEIIDRDKFEKNEDKNATAAASTTTNNVVNTM